ncbi:DUF3168 domain-containing protein [Donghicola eburneus]|uniref:Putative gene transfer agent protein n=1 Tax=Donghicola eburneus TaxID=393278 RepID=A0A1M4MZC1_9RHOB|nr:DUF3168 domain-containing protein [Donghicola eburneus]SCM67942.1 putative gene transfer agent protein [Donghicola eburneus]SFQ53779.1 Protein of unknown function [Donghicola eburneus]
MSYQRAGALQTALFSHLAADSALSALIGDALYDAVPSGTLPETYVMMGEEEAKDAADPLGQDARHDFTLSIVSTAQGFLMAKTVAAAIGQALEIAPVSLTEGRVVWLRFRKAKAQRNSETRQIDLKYRAYLAAN